MKITATLCREMNWHAPEFADGHEQQHTQELGRQAAAPVQQSLPNQRPRCQPAHQQQQQQQQQQGQGTIT
jgi:hypothetical protein